MLLPIKKYLVVLWEIFLKILSYPLYFLSGFFPRNRKVWLFGSWNGKKFRGNSKYLYLYVKKNYPDVFSVWICKDHHLTQRLQKEGIKAYYAYSLKGFFLALRAKYFFVTHGIRDLNEFVSRGGTMINLEHAIYPLKEHRISPRGSLLRKAYLYLRTPYVFLVKPDYAVTGSKFTAAMTKHHFGISDDRIISAGTPKTDFLLKAGAVGAVSFGDKGRTAFYNTDKKRILFLPTWRADREFSTFNFSFDYKALDDLLKEINAVFAVKLHPFAREDRKIIEGFIDKPACNNIKFIQEDEINMFLCKIDLLITDYSSIFADFLIYDKPIIFAKFGHEAYLREKELLIDYDNDLPGPKACDWPQLIYHIRESFLGGEDRYQTKRGKLKDLIYPRPDGKACERITKFVFSLSG